MRRTNNSTRAAVGGSLTLYLDQIGRYPLLSREEEIDLGRRIRAGDRKALDTLVCANLRFVVSLAKKCQTPGIALADLVNEGNMGLMRAARKFDETRGIRFMTYAAWWIRQAILQARSEQSRLIRVPTHRARSIHHAHLSLDAPLAHGQSGQLFEHLPDVVAPRPDEQVLRNSLRDSIERALSRLKPREAKIVRLYFGLDDDDAMTLEEIGTLLDVTRERVRQIRDQALQQMRRALSEHALSA